MSASSDKPDESGMVGAPRASIDTRLSDSSRNSDNSQVSDSSRNMSRKPTLVMDDSGQAQSDMLVGIVLAIGLALIVGFFVLFMANETILMTDMNGTDENNTDPLAPAQEELVTTTIDTFGMYGLLFMAVIFSIALIFLWRIRGQA